MAQLILIINDTQVILQLFEQILTGAGYEVSLHSYDQFSLDVVKELKPDLIISDHSPTETLEKVGWQFLQLLKMDRETEKIPVIVCTMDVMRSMQSDGHLTDKGIRVILKPFTTSEILKAVQALIGEAGETEKKEVSPEKQLETKREKAEKAENGSAGN